MPHCCTSAHTCFQPGLYRYAIRFGDERWRRPAGNCCTNKLSKKSWLRCEESIEPVFFKGTALAYGLYANPVWRDRGDTDMIVPQDASPRRRRADVVGLSTQHAVSGEFVSYQDSYTKECKDGGRHTIDLHRRINNSELLSRLFSYAELRAEACALPRCARGRWPSAQCMPCCWRACTLRPTNTIPTSSMKFHTMVVIA